MNSGLSMGTLIPESILDDTLSFLSNHLSIFQISTRMFGSRMINSLRSLFNLFAVYYLRML